MEQFDVIIIKTESGKFYLQCLSLPDRATIQDAIRKTKPVLGKYDILLTEGCTLDYSELQMAYIIRGKHTRFKYQDSLILPDDSENWDFIIEDVEPGLINRKLYGSELKRLGSDLMFSREKIKKEFILPREVVAISKHFF